MKYNKRAWIIFASAVPLIALFTLLAWASVRTGGNPGGFGVNSELGEVNVASDMAKGFSFELLNGSYINLSDYRGKVVMIDFWASWCTPCREEAPALAEVYLEYVDLPVEFIGINIWDSVDAARAYVSQFELQYPNGVDKNGVIAINYGVRGIPEKLFVDPKGAIMKRFVGPMNQDTLRAILNELLT
jgi:thiol-disulfide isomerase/thioredoxin